MIDIEKLARENGFVPTEHSDGECYADIRTLKQFAEAYHAEKQREQEPVAWVCGGELYLTKEDADSSKRDWSLVANPLYALKD